MYSSCPRQGASDLYQIGDVLAHKAQVEPFRFHPNSWRPMEPMCLLVVEQITQRCSGGEQYLYTVRLVTGTSIGIELAQLHECELVPYPEKSPEREKAGLERTLPEA